MRMSRVIILGLAGGAILPTLAGATEQDINLTANVADSARFRQPDNRRTEQHYAGRRSPTSQSVVDVVARRVSRLASWRRSGFHYTSNGTCNNVKSTSSYTQRRPQGSGPPAARSPAAIRQSVRLSGDGVVGMVRHSHHFRTTGTARAHVTLSAGSRNPHAGSVNRRLTCRAVDPNASRLVMAGDYTDTLTVTVDSAITTAG